MIRYGKLSLKQVLDAVNPDLIKDIKYEKVLQKLRRENRLEFKTDNETYFVHLVSQRILLFKRDAVDYKVSCVKCGIQGSWFAVESHTTEAPHLNLYAEVDGVEVLMTKSKVADDFEVKCYNCIELTNDKSIT